MSRIDPDKPLPSHTKIRYEECVAKMFLEWADNHIYHDLVMRDKPDLYCENSKTGIEVTEAVDSAQKEAENLWIQIPFSSDEKAKRLKTQMKKLGFEYQGGVQSWGGKNYSNGVCSYPYNDLYSTVERKLDVLLKGQYYNCDKYELFVETNILIQKDWCGKLFEKINALNLKYELRFSRIIILSQLSFVFLDFELKKFKYMQVDSRVYCELVCKARKMVEEAENE